MYRYMKLNLANTYGKCVNIKEGTNMKETKTNHKTGWHKRTVNPTTNYAPDTHKQFCKRCLAYHNNECPNPYGMKECSL